MKQKIKKLISFLEDNQLELESLVFNKGKLSFQVSDNKFQKYSSISKEIVIDDIDKYILPITQEQVNKVINTVVKDEWVFNPFDYGFEEAEIEGEDNSCIGFIKYPDASNHRVYFIIKERYWNGSKVFDFRRVEPKQHFATYTFVKINDKEYIESILKRFGVIEKTQTTFDGEKQVNIEDEKITDYKFCPLNFFGFRYNERGYFIKERKDEGDKITSTFIMYPSNRESNSKTRWTFKRYNDKGIEITFYGDLTFKSYEEVEQFFFRNGVIKCD